MRGWARIALLAGSLVIGLDGAGAQVPERPGLYFERCGRCHGGAGELAVKSLTVVDGRLVGRKSGRDVAEFLKRHYGRLSAEEREIVTQALLRVAQGRGRFKVRCGICHESAEALARLELILVEGELRGRYTGRMIADFLIGHGTRSADEAAFFTDVLRRHSKSTR